MISRNSRGRNRSTGRGWYGDERGHAEAAREGWQQRRGGRSRDYDDDDSQRSSRSRGRRGNYDEDEDNYQSSSRSRGGEYEEDDDDDYGSSSRGGRRNSSSGEGRGWYGDEEGHSEAAM